MPERQDPEVSRGLRGWRAGAAMVGCGTIAGLAVVGAVIGGAQALTGMATTADSPDEPGIAGGGTGRPQATLDPGTLDLCSTTVPTTSSINVTRLDEDDDYVDTELEQDSETRGRTVSDACEWDLVPDYEYFEPWAFTLSYRAEIPSAEGEDPVAVANEEFEDRVADLDSQVASVTEEGDGEYADRSYFVYGPSQENAADTAYTVVAQTRSAVYEIGLEAEPVANGEAVPRAAFEHEVAKMITRMEIDLGIWIPESE
jgi:hypothetical protein